MVDGSGSIGRQNFMKMENFLKGLVGKLDVGPNNVHVGLMQFSSRPQREFPLNMYTNRQDAMTGKITCLFESSKVLDAAFFM